MIHIFEVYDAVVNGLLVLPPQAVEVAVEIMAAKSRWSPVLVDGFIVGGRLIISSWACEVRMMTSALEDFFKRVWVDILGPSVADGPAPFAVASLE